MPKLTHYKDAFVNYAAQRIIAKFSPGIIAILANPEQRMATEAAMEALSSVRSIAVIQTHNGRGFEYAVTGAPTEKGFWNGIKAIAVACKTAFIKNSYPELLIFECLNHAEAENLLLLTRPQITVIAGINDNDRATATAILGAMPSNGYAIINADSEHAKAAAHATRARAVTFGFENGADLMLGALVALPQKNKAVKKPRGISFTVSYGSQTAHVVMENGSGKPSAYIAASALCLGTAFGLHIARTAETLRYLEIHRH